MKKCKGLLIIGAAIFCLGLYSCNEDSFSEEDAMRLQAQLDKQKQLDQDSMDTRNYRVSYTINLVDASTSTLKSASLKSAINGAIVKFVQDSLIITKTADASGIVAITNVKPGMANVNISLTNYSEVNYTVNLSSAYYNGGRQVSNIIPLIPISGTFSGIIQGKVICETDLTNKTPETVPAGTKVLAMVRASSDALPSTGSNNIVSISYDNLSLQATTDVNGNFSMTVPATILGLDYDITVSDFKADQKLLQYTYFNRDTFGVLTIPTSFGSSFQSASDLDAGNPVIVTVGAPDYTFTPAAATAVIDNPSGIEYIQNTNVGKYYFDGADFYTTIDNPGVQNGGTKAVIYFRSSNGHVSASISSSGSKYPAVFGGTTVNIPYIRVPAKAVVDAVNGAGAITSYHVAATKRGEFFSYDNLQFVKHTGAGTGSVTVLPAANNSGYLYFQTTVQTLATPVGSGFVAGDSLVLSVKTDMSDVYAGKLHLTTGTVTAINITNEGANYISGQVDVVIGSPVSGNTARATANVNNGRISTITINNAGNGYSTAPAVTIVNKAEKSQALFTANVSGGKVTSFYTVNAGKGYLAVPNVTITPAITGTGTGASAYATVSNGSVSLTLVNQGNGYFGNNPSSARSYSGTTFTTVKGNGTSIVNIDLGTGKRSVEY